eukprot:927563-Rhodomonas_salina.1
MMTPAAGCSRHSRRTPLIVVILKNPHPAHSSGSGPGFCGPSEPQIRQQSREARRLLRASGWHSGSRVAPALGISTTAPRGTAEDQSLRGAGGRGATALESVALESGSSVSVTVTLGDRSPACSAA